VVVIGGGAVGLSVLYHLAKAGCGDAVLLEKDELTSGSTWHAAGNIPTFAASWGGMRAGNYAWRLYSALAEGAETPITYRHTGAFWPAHNRDRMEFYHHLVGISKGLGYDLRMVTPGEMEAMHPFYRAGETVIGGIHDPYEGDLDPSQLTQALAKSARAAGAEVVRFTPVTAIERSRSGEWRVHSAQGAVTCEVVVNAAGYYGAEVARLLGQSLPVVTLEHQYLVTEARPEIAATEALFPLVRDPDIMFYLRRERDGLLFGSYGHAAHPTWPDGPPSDFASQLFPDRLEDIAEVLENAIAHLPILAEAGAQRFVNGPIPYSPDGAPLCGPAFGLANVYHACCFPVGITHSAAAGKAIAEWVLEGETEWDPWAWDPRRFGPWATPDYTAARACELYEHQYAIPYPHRLWHSARPVLQSRLYDRLKAKGAVFGQVGGWERAFWFARDGLPDDGHLSFRDEAWHDAVRGECEAVRDGVGVMDHPGFTRYEVEGPGAGALLDRVFCGRLPAVGRVKLSYMLTPKGKVWSEATIARLAEDRFLLCGPTLAEQRDFDWLTGHAAGAESLRLRRGSERDAALMVMGPKSREPLSRLTSADLSRDAAPWMSVREIELAGLPVTALRVSYVGELGWELHLSSSHLSAVYDAILEAGADLGLRDFGSYALNAMRLEKGYHAWQADFGPEYTPFEAGLDRFIAFEKPDFVGREAVLGVRDEGPRWVFRGFALDSPQADALASAPIYCHGEIAGYVTSAGTGFRLGQRLALGFLRAEFAEAREGFAIEVLGERRPARHRTLPFYDPENLRPRS
jgi:dimethylglycine dehydrogenase